MFLYSQEVLLALKQVLLSYTEEEIRCVFDDNWKIIFAKSS